MITHDSLNNVKQAAQQTNLIHEYPQLSSLIYDRGEEDAYGITSRLGMVSEEEWFNTALHWFAPVGQDSLVVKPVNEDGSEIDVPISNYSDYQAWKETQASQ